MRFVHLAEGMEKEVLFVAGDADAGVGNGESDLSFSAGCSAPHRNADFHLPFFGELDGIACQVCQDLVNPCLIAYHDLWHITSHREIETDSLDLYDGIKDAECVFHASPQSEGFVFYQKLAHLDFGQIEDVVEYTDQGKGRGVSRADEFPLVRFQVA